MKYKSFFTLISVFLLILTLVPLATAAENNDRIKASMEAFADCTGEIIGVSSKGEWDNYPENSIPAITEAAATDIDFVLIDVKKAGCGTLILFSDDTTERMLECENVFTVSETDYSELSKYKLRNSCGGSNEKETQYSIPTLSEALSTAKENDIPLIIRCSADILGAVTDEITKEDALSMCIVMTDGKIKEINAALQDTKSKPYIIGTKKGNVIFDVASYINGLEEMNAVGANLKTVNRYGINFYFSTLRSFSENMRMILDHTIPEVSGFREDSEMYWNDVISRGYSVIITDHAVSFAEYKADTDIARQRLRELYNKYVTNHTLPVFKDEVLSDLKKAYTDAVALSETLLSDNSSSLQDLTECYGKLFKAANDVNKNFASLEDGSAGTSITVPRIILCVAAVIAVIAVQIYFFKRRRKVM